MGRMVVLRHTLPDGSSHLDLLLERGSDAERRAMTFRLPLDTDVLSAAEFAADRIADHRTAYFDYEGPIPAPGDAAPARADRGHVRRVLAGSCVFHVDSPDLLEVSLTSGNLHSHLTAEPLSEDRSDPLGAWWFTRT